MNIRQATNSDIPTLVSLNRTVQSMHADAFPARFRRDAPDEVVTRAFAAMLESPTAYWLVAEEEAPVGFLNAEFRERAESWCLTAQRVCYLAGIVVAPQFRRRGVAKALFDELKQEATTRGVSDIDLDVWAFNDDARQVFTKLGFKPVMERMTLATEKPSHT